MDALDKNQDIYDRIWATLPSPQHTAWPIWPDLSRELAAGGRALELGCGVLPRIPIAGGYFADLSPAALDKLHGLGGHCVRSAGSLPFSDRTFQVVCAFEVLEHIPDDERTLVELSRVLVPGGALFLSVPVEPALFTRFDTAVGHVRRYDAKVLAARLAEKGLVIERWATQPNNFSPMMGHLAGAFLDATRRLPRLTVWLKRKAIAGELQLKLVWRTDDIANSHADGGLIAIARRRDPGASK